MVYICTIGVLLERRQGLGLVPLTAWQRAGGVHMFYAALPTGGEADDDSFSWAVSILASRYLSVPLRRYFCIPLIITQTI